MNFIQKRFLLFLGICIPTRFMIGYLAKKESFKKYLNYLAIICLVMGLGFLYIYFFGSNEADGQLQWAGVNKIWWNDIRIIHGFSYVLFPILIYLKYSKAYYVIYLDTLFGLISFLYYHYLNNNFYKLI